MEKMLKGYKSHCERISGKKGLFACQGCREEFADYIRAWISEIIINADHKYEGEHLRHAFNHVKADLLKSFNITK